MKMKITSKTENGRQVFRVGDLPFSTQVEAEEFVDWVSRLLRRRRELTEAAEVWSEMQQQEQSGSGVMLHDLVSGLAYLSFILATAGAMEQIHLAMLHSLLKKIEKELGVKTMTKAEAAAAMGEKWGKENIGTSIQDKLRTTQEPAPPEWVEMVRAAEYAAEAAASKKKKSDGPKG